MGNKYCYYTTYGLKLAQAKYGKELGLNNSAFVNMAINKFLNGDQEINPDFLITIRKDPNYVVRDEMDQVMLSVETKGKLEAIAKKYKCSVAVIVFQSVYDLCFELEYNEGKVQL